MDATTSTAAAPTDTSIWGDVQGIFSGALTTAEDFYNKYLGFQLYKAQADAASTQAQAPTYTPQPQPVVYPQPTYTPQPVQTSGPFAGVQGSTMVIIAGVALAALVLLRR